MPKSPFSMFQDYVNPPKRNTFDLGFTNNLTLNLGGLYPVLVQEVLPGDSFRIKSAFGLRFMPMVFPVQTRMRAHLHYFYVRKRNLWKDFPDFFGNIRQLVEPSYIPGDTSTFRTRSLEDYMGIPTVSHSRVDVPFDFGSRQISMLYPCVTSCIDDSGKFLPADTLADTFDFSNHGIVRGKSVGGRRISYYISIFTELVDNPFFGLSVNDGVSQVFDFYAGVRNVQSDLESEIDGSFSSPALVAPFYISHLAYSVEGSSHVNYIDLARYGLYDSLDVKTTSGFAIIHQVSHIDEAALRVLSSISGNVRFGFVYCFSPDIFQANYVGQADASTSMAVSGSLGHFEESEIRDLPSDKFPYGLASDGKIPINVLPFRAYESIYNSYYRDYRNNPLYDESGNPVYNKYILHDGDSSDKEVYKLRYRNWQQDFLTTALASPQQGVAPLVGISSTGQLRFQASEDGKEYTVQAKVADDGDTITGVEVKDNLPGSVARSLVDVATSGISINDFRNVNSLQRWLETNLRRGLRFKDQIEAHFGVSPSYAELDMPEFLGGVSADVNINPISQTADGIGDLPLGWQAGQGSAFSSQEFSVSRYFDEPGYVIGILSVVPQPVYSQVLPKLFLKRENLDYFYPEFGHIGMQPITYKEISPVETFVSLGLSGVDSTFGYQRAWYDYMSRVDESHGLFRSNLRNFLMNREFATPPVLGSEFLVIDPDSVNDVFNVQDTDVSDKILGQIVFDIVGKRPIPMYGIPRLE